MSDAHAHETQHPDERPTYDDEAYPEEGYDDGLVYDQPPANPRRTQATIVMVLAGIVFVASLVVLAAFLGDSQSFRDAFDFWALRTWIWIFVAMLLALLVWLLILMFTTPAREEQDWFEDDAAPLEEEDLYPVAGYGEPGAPDTIALRCPKCVNVFTLQDPGERPFYHICPHCDVRGVYKGE